MEELGRVGYLLIASTMATHAVSALGRGLSREPLTLTYGGRRVEVYSVEDSVAYLSRTAKSLFDFIMLLLTRYNNNKEKKWRNDTILFTLQDFMYFMGYKDTRDMRYQALDQLIKDVTALGSLQLREEGAWWFGLVVSGGFVNADGGRATEGDIIAGEACIKLTAQSELLEHLCGHLFFVPYLVCLARRTRHNENAYALAKRMILHYSQSCNQGRVGQQRLKVKTLLGVCPANTARAVGNIRRTFERAMDLLASQTEFEGPLITWSYLYNGRRCMPEQIKSKRLPQKAWLELVIEFEPTDLLAGETEWAVHERLDSAYDLVLRAPSQKVYFLNDENQEEDRSEADDAECLPSAYTW